MLGGNAQQHCSCVQSDGLMLPRPMRDRAWRLYTHPYHPMHKQIWVDSDARTTEESDLHAYMWCGVHFKENVASQRRSEIGKAVAVASNLQLKQKTKDFLNASVATPPWYSNGFSENGFNGLTIVGESGSGKSTIARLMRVIWESWGYKFSIFDNSDLMNSESSMLALRHSNAVLIDDIVFTSQGYQQLNEIAKFRVMIAGLTQKGIPTILVFRHPVKVLTALDIMYLSKRIGPVLEVGA